MIRYFDRKTQRIEEEKVAGGRYIDWIYSSPVGMSLLESIIKKRWLSALYGKYCDSRMSKRQIDSFIRQLQINMEEAANKAEEFETFNSFFARKLKAEARTIEKASKILISCGDGRALAYENIDGKQMIQVKGLSYSLEELLGDAGLAREFDQGNCFILRLAPVDYHRFHFVDAGVCEAPRRIRGSFYSVNPKALETVPKVFCQNEREISIFHTENFGKVLYVEVGATFVGSITQTYVPNQRVEKGAEKGYFTFGGSTVIMLFKNDRLKMDQDLLENTKKGLETKVLMGERIGCIF